MRIAPFLLALLMLLVAPAAAQTPYKLLTFTAAEEHPCPSPAPTVTANPDGTWSRVTPPRTGPMVCARVTTWRELWTDRPDRGGAHVRRGDDCQPVNGTTWRCGADLAVSE